MKVIGKEQLCVCKDYKRYFKSIQGLGEYTLFDRYKDLENIVDKNVKKEYRHFLAQPEFDGDNIHWFSEPYYEVPKRLSELHGQDHDQYEKVKKETVSHYSEVVKKLKSENKKSEAEALEKAIKFVNDVFVYCYDGKTVLGVWGMEPRDEVRDPLGIAMQNSFVKPRKPKPSVSGDEDGKDNDADDGNDDGSDETDPENHQGEDSQDDNNPLDDDFLSVRFDAAENGSLLGKTEYEMRRGKRVSADMIPDPEADEGFEFVGWDVEPNNHEVVDDVVFTAQFKKKSYKVRFFDGGHGSLSGQTEYDKYYEERVHANEVPKVNPDEGYRFVGWDKTPVDYVVKEDTEFVAQYEEEKDSWWSRFWGWGSGCLNWLLTLLLLGLIALLLWYLLGKHNFSFCGCDCGCNEYVVVPDTSITPKPKPVPIDTIHDGEEVPKPTKNCGVHFSGWYLSDRDDYPGDDCSEIFQEETYGEYVGQGYYTDNTKILPKAMKYSFDAVAVSKGTRLIMYSEPNFKGRVVLDVKGPMLIENVIAKGMYDKLMRYKFKDELQELFPPERRQWSSENMHSWANGSCKIICEQCEAN